MERNLMIERQSDKLKALGHPVRLQIAMGLCGGNECNVNKIVEQLQLPQSTVSQHLGILKAAGIITYRKEGVRTCYRVVDELAQIIVKRINAEMKGK